MAIKRTKAISRPEIEKNYQGNLTNEEQYNQELFAQTRNMQSAFYSGVDPRRRVEMADAAMVQEDPNAVANLSSRFIHREYPRQGFSANPFLDAIRED